MGNKRKQDQRRDDSSSSSSSSDAKRRRSRHYHVGETIRANGGTPTEGVVGVFRDTVLEFKDAIQVKGKTKRKIDKLKEKGKKYKEDLRILKEELRILKEGQEDLRILKEGQRILKEELRVLKEGQDDLRILKEDHRILKEQLRILKEGQEDHKTTIQEMQKGGCAEVDHYRASSSQRSQSSESPKFNLQIENVVSSTIYKRETVTTEDCSGQIKVTMYDGDHRIPSGHPLASVKVQLVVINGSFNDDNKVSWSKEDFANSIIKGRGGKRLVANGTFCLIDGSCYHEGAIIMDNSQQKEFKLGVMVAVPTKVRVLEGVSNPFKVQEIKTKVSKKKDKKPSPVPAPNLEHPTSTQATQHGQGPVSPDEQHSLSPPVIQDISHKEDRRKHTEVPTEDTGEDNGLSYPPVTVAQMVEGNGEASCLGLPLSCCPPLHSIQNTLQVAGHFPVNQPLLACGQDQYTSLLNASSQLAFPNLYAQVNDIQWESILGDETSFGDTHCLNVQTQIQETYGTFRYGQVLLQWDNPHVELKKHWNILDQLMPLYSTKSRFLAETFPSTSLMDKAHKLLASISSGNFVSKMITGGMSQATQTPQRRGVLIRPIGAYDSEDKPLVKKQRNAKYQLRFVNRACYDYYTQEQIKSEDGNLLKVALYDENNLVVTSGQLSSSYVEVVLLHGDFNAEGQDYCTPEEFSTCILHPQSAKEPPALGGDCVLALTDGEAELGNVNFQTSSFHARTGKFKMGVVIKNVREESIQEGITSPFLVRVRLGEGTGNSTRCPDPLLLSSERRQRLTEESQPTEESQRPPEWLTARGQLRWSRAVLLACAASRRRRVLVKAGGKIRRHPRPQARAAAAAAKAAAAASASEPPLLKEWKVKGGRRVLGQLVPGCGKLQAPDLPEEAADYVAALEMEVKRMRAIADALAAFQLSLNPQPVAGDDEAEMER